jgi:NADH-quinone oxidoreductase subunit L
MLYRLLPVTAVTFIIGWLSIAGVFPFSGFWSKDEILVFAFADNFAFYFVAGVTALLTAYYMTRQVIMVFFGEARWKPGLGTTEGIAAARAEGSASDEAHAARGQSEAEAEPAGDAAHGDSKPHESPWVMLGPLVVLAVLSTIGGVLNLPFSDSTELLGRWLHPVVEPAPGIGEAHIDGTWADDNKYVLAAIALAVAILGIIAAYLVYQRKRVKAVEPPVLANAWYYDQAISEFVGGPGQEAFEATAWFDAHVVDGAINGAGTTVRETAGVVRRGQNGYVRAYAGIIGAGVAIVLAWLVIAQGIL